METRWIQRLHADERRRRSDRLRAACREHSYGHRVHTRFRYSRVLSGFYDLSSRRIAKEIIENLLAFSILKQILWPRRRETTRTTSDWPNRQSSASTIYFQRKNDPEKADSKLEINYTNKGLAKWANRHKRFLRLSGRHAQISNLVTLNIGSRKTSFFNTAGGAGETWPYLYSLLQVSRRRTNSKISRTNPH